MYALRSMGTPEMMMMSDGAPEVAEAGVIKPQSAVTRPPLQVRQEFPETWIFQSKILQRFLFLHF